MSPRVATLRGERGKDTTETVTDKFEPFVRTCEATSNKTKKLVNILAAQNPASDLCAGISVGIVESHNAHHYKLYDHALLAGDSGDDVLDMAALALLLP